jgi:hypothetical protein
VKSALNKTKKKGKKCKINPYDLPDLQLTPHGFKMNSNVLDVCQKDNIVLIVKFCSLI